jgi:undecaprenyl pyrophosphate phosphatase UppP
METYRKFILIGIIIIALGITFSSTLKEEVYSLGNVMIAVGGLFLIIGMSKKQKEDKNKP